MPAFLVAFLSFLKPIFLSVVGTVIAALGISFISYLGVNTLTESLFTYVQSNMSGLPSDAIQFLYMFKILTCFNMICSAYVGKFAVSGTKKLIFQ
jgi:hypothetical protein